MRGGDGSCLIDVELEIAEVVLTDAELKHLVDDRKQVIQRADGLEWNGIGRAEDAAGGSQDERIFDDGHRHATIIKNSCEEAIIATNSASGSRRSSIGIENFTDVILFGDLHDFVSGFQLWGSRRDGPSMRTVWQ